MSPQLLEEIGLNSSQAKVYLALIEKGALTPPAVSEVTNENRTNAYMVLEQLEKLGLAEKLQKAKKLTYQATNPINLEKVSEKRRKAVMDAEAQDQPAAFHYIGDVVAEWLGREQQHEQVKPEQ